MNFTRAHLSLLTTECRKLVHIWMPALQTSIFGQMSFTATDLYHKLQSLLPTTSSHSYTLSSRKLTQLSLSCSRFEGCQGPQHHNNQFFYPPATQTAWKLEFLQLPISCLESKNGSRCSHGYWLPSFQASDSGTCHTHRN